VNENFQQFDGEEPVPLFPPEPAFNHTLLPTFANVTVVVPGVNVLHVYEFVEYNRSNEGGDPDPIIDTAAFGSSAVKQSPQ
jgi:hypothetical protein